MADVVSFPMDCPACKTISGQVHTLDSKIRQGVIYLGMRCAYCAHEWRHTHPVTVSTHDSGVRKPYKPDA